MAPYASCLLTYVPQGDVIYHKQEEKILHKSLVKILVTVTAKDSSFLNHTQKCVHLQQTSVELTQTCQEPWSMSC